MMKLFSDTTVQRDIWLIMLYGRMMVQIYTLLCSNVYQDYKETRITVQSNTTL